MSMPNGSRSKLNIADTVELKESGLCMQMSGARHKDVSTQGVGH